MSERIPFTAKEAHAQVNVRITVDTGRLEGTLTFPPDRVRGIVLFAHGSGSGRFSPRNQYVAGAFQRGGLATLLIDLLTADEERVDALSGEFRFNIELLSHRLVTATDWIVENDTTGRLPIGYFGASTGAAAALIASTMRPAAVRCIVSRGGRPDMAGDALRDVNVPTLLIVGGYDDAVIELNKQALAELTVKKELVIIPGASHLFEEPGKLDEVAILARHWFEQHIDAPSDTSR